jgi:hypothetical protein
MTALYTIVNQSGKLELRCPFTVHSLVHTMANFGYAACETETVATVCHTAHTVCIWEMGALSPSD